MTERKPQILLDHDNLLTHGFAEYPLYHAEYFENFSESFHIPLRELTQLIKDAEHMVDSQPYDHVLRVGDRIIGPATTDHIWRTYSIAKVVLKSWRTVVLHEPEADADEDEKKFNHIYRYSYPRAGTIYRHDAKEVVVDLYKTGRLSIVTGSDTTDVRRQMAELLKNTQIDIHELDIWGNAKKSYVDVHRETHTPEHILPAEYFPYPIYLRKPVYASILRSFENGIGAVVSDSYTYDLALPEYMNILTILLINEFTAGFEARYYTNHPHGKLVYTLTEARESIDHLI